MDAEITNAPEYFALQRSDSGGGPAGAFFLANAGKTVIIKYYHGVL